MQPTLVALTVRKAELDPPMSSVSLTKPTPQAGTSTREQDKKEKQKHSWAKKMNPVFMKSV